MFGLGKKKGRRVEDTVPLRPLCPRATMHDGCGGFFEILRKSETEWSPDPLSQEGFRVVSATKEEGEDGKERWTIVLEVWK